MRWMSTAVAMVLVIALCGPGTAARADASGTAARAGAPGAPGARPGERVVTLVTGDQVLVSGGTGAPSIRVRRAPGRDRIHFSVRGAGDGLHVEPSDALRLVAAGRLDERLFNISLLIEQGYDDARRADVPVIAERADGGRPVAPYGARTTASLPGLGMDALKIDKRSAGAAWASIARGGPRTLGSGAAKLWLDGRRQATLDRSVPRIDAPAAWRKGLTGKGVTVAVLDTGVDAAHPDLMGAVSQSRGFTDRGAGDVTDRHGHGTHVASTVAGSAAASGGRYKGVAPDAKLAVGKVLGDFGGGYESWILAGMEWAAARARVVNMSLGGTDQQGTDPLEKAVDALSARTGALFVVAAGNAGESGGRTVGTPATADAALAVGAADADDAPAEFSARGPRVGDHALKPDITAPGVDIAAARAKGTFSGRPVGEHYQRMSGTSMAAPHVAGAAAILAQQRPGWKGSRLKAALMSSARPGAHNPYRQGAGRVDVGRATSQAVVPSEGAMSTYLRWPGRAPVQRAITYTNTTGRPMALDLSVSGAPKGLFRPDATRLRLPAGGAATVRLTIGGGRPGVHVGELRATAPGLSVRTPLSAYVEPPAHELTIKAIDRVGRPSDQPVQILGLDSEHSELALAPGKVRLPDGRWNLLATILTEEGEDLSVALVAITVRVGRTGTAVLDARTAKQVRTTIDEPTAEIQSGVNLGLVYDDGRVHYNFGILLLGDERQLFATPLRQRHLTFYEHTTWLKRGWDQDHPSPYRYDLVNRRTEGIPADPVHRARTRDLTKIKTTLRGQNADSYGAPLNSPVIDLGDGRSLALFFAWDMALPTTITQYFTADPDLVWRRAFALDGFSGVQVFIDPDRRLRGTPSPDVWAAAAMGPALTATSAVRSGDTVRLLIDALFSDPVRGRVGKGFGDAGQGTITLRSGDRTLATSDFHEPLRVEVPPGEARYSLRASATRSPYFATLSTKVEADWTFRSRRTRTGQPLPLRVVRLAPRNLDDQNRAKAGSTTPVTIRVERNPGIVETAGPPPIVESSFDNGTTWRRLALQPTRDGWTANVPNPATGAVSLRATATAADSTVRQTILSAYAIAPS